jgi:hypothetical protein
MPNGIFPIPEFQTVPGRSRAPGLAARVKARWRRKRLDAALAAGADPRTTTALGLRAERLRTHEERGRVAMTLVEAAHRRAEVGDCADDLLALARRLRDDLPVDARGVAMAARLVDDPKGPLRREGGGDLRRAIESAREAMDTRRQIAGDVRHAA